MNAPFKSYSQAAQDLFALAVCPNGKTFLDVGACHPTEISNTYVLICADVCSAEGLPFEDWWVAQDVAASAERFRCVGKRWTEIFPL